MRVYKCSFLGLIHYDGTPVASFPIPHGVRAKVRMHEDHDLFGSQAGGITVTSELKMIDFERGIFVTQNNIYDFGSNRTIILAEVEDFHAFLRDNFGIVL